MPDARRPYRSTLRQDQARSTRRAIVAAARDLFVELGWSRTTIDAVAARAGVSRKTVFASVGGKAALLKLAMDWALVGDDEPIAMSERQVIAELEQITDPQILLARWARFVADLEERAAPLAAVLVVAADADPDAALVHSVSERNRLGGAEFIVARLTATGGLRAGLSTRGLWPPPWCSWTPPCTAPWSTRTAGPVMSTPSGSSAQPWLNFSRQAPATDPTAAHPKH